MSRKVAVITGGSSGIGRACALAFTQAGYQVFELSRSGEDQPGIRHITADVSQVESVRAAFAQLTAELDGMTGIDVLVVSAGYGIAGAIECTDDATMQQQFAVNLFGAVRTVQAALPLLRISRGRTFFISSVAAELALPFQAFYSMSKAAINQLALALNNELRAAGLSFTAIMPGDLATGFTAVRDYPKRPEEEVLYGDMPARAIAKMAADELGGSSPEGLAQTIVKLSERRCRPKALRGFELKYRAVLLLAKILPVRLSNYIIGRIYAR
ncbi:MAG: SDR family NAD(P)-dependent oxidoreductase [Eubacteriales bacterium]|nr:SDR family NAD(P)-dependent oxidoreductase [Eubacteriales bacterium]